MIKLSVPNSAKYMEGKILWGETQRRFHVFAEKAR